MNKFTNIIFSYQSLFLVILAIAFILRLYSLSSLPAGYHGDEASFFYNAIALATTGKDEDGRSFQPFLLSFIDPKPALFSYVQIPFYLTFGNSIFASRLPSVLFGVGSLIVIYIIFKELLDKRIASIIFFLLAISPWHIMNSRATQEVIMSFFFATLSWLMFVYLEKKSTNKIVGISLYGLFLILGCYSYHAINVIMPLLFFIMTIFNYKRDVFSRKITILILGVTVVTFVITLFISGFTRFGDVSIFNDQGTKLMLNERLRTATGGAPYVVNRLFNNKLTAYSYTLATNYFEYYNPSFLFLNGGQPQRYQIPYMGLFYPFEIILFFYGMFKGLTAIKYKYLSIIMLIWFMLIPIPAVVTSQEVPSTIRTFLLIIPVIYFIAVGIVGILSFKMTNIKLISYLLLGLCYLLGLSYYLFEFNVQEPRFHPYYRNNETFALVNEIKKIGSHYKRIYIFEDTYIFFALKGLIPLSLLQKSYPERIKGISNLGKYTFVLNYPCRVIDKVNTLTVLTGQCQLADNPSHAIVDVIYYPDQIPAYKIYTYKPILQRNKSE